MSASSGDSEEPDVIRVSEHLVDTAVGSDGEVLRLDTCPACDKEFFGGYDTIYGTVATEDLTRRVIAVLIAHHFIEHKPEDFGLDDDPGEHEYVPLADICLETAEEEAVDQ